MELDTGTVKIQARVSRLTHSAGITRGEITCISDDMVWCVPVTISGVTQKRGAGLIMAIGRLIGGAVVMDGEDFLAIQDSLGSARRIA